MGENKQVRVDNWGMFFLQRLQLFFSKTDYCDLTLQFQGNVQLKVHRLVLNACTEYFEILEHSDRLIEENVILMPDMLQADVVVPIINFMYTGMLEYPMNIYHKLYQAADIMRLSILTKLLDAQRVTKTSTDLKKKSLRPATSTTPIPETSPIFAPSKKSTPMKSSVPELPSTLPGRKLPVWKRKTVPSTSNSSSNSTRHSALNEAPKPTRFEWPEDDLELPTTSDLMDVSGFGDISYTSKPLLREEEVKTMLGADNKKSKSKSDEPIEDEIENDVGLKRKGSSSFFSDKLPKKIKIVENETDTTISVFSSETSPNCDPTKIVSEILKKYPHLVKQNKSIKLKIISKPEKETRNEKEESDAKNDIENKVWQCRNCVESNGKPMEFILYYLYRKHMTDVHHVTFDPRICKYCGVTFNKNELHAFHLFTKHGIKPTGNHFFPSCNQCPYVAVSKHALAIHKTKHKKSEVQCTICKLAFTSAEAMANHIQITGHTMRVKKQLHDCQYCMKTSQSPLSLLSHIKSDHEAEAKRDGIVSLDEIDTEEANDDNDESEEHSEEYVLSEEQPDKVKIISDVKVPSKIIAGSDVVSGKNVPTSIATSLGLLDIVVLDESQQFILQNPEEHAEETQTEYIIPPRNNAEDGLATSTDELVMVLTDQDYKDGTNTIASDNSNIVVLYSHPADGQQGQFITSQGNLMVNSETGMLEIRNGAIASTSSNQIVVGEHGANDHIETIEMIQREIDGNPERSSETIQTEQQQIPDELPQKEVHTDSVQSLETTSIPTNPDNEMIETNQHCSEETEKMDVKIEHESIVIHEETVKDEIKEEHLSVSTENPGNVEADTVVEETTEGISENNLGTEQNEKPTLEENINEPQGEELSKGNVQNGAQNEATIAPDGEKPYSPTDNPIDMQCDIESNPESNEKDVDSINENSMEVENQENDENSQSSASQIQKNNDEAEAGAQTEEENANETVKESAKIAILDDWDDTDSQHSDKPKPVVTAETTVVKNNEECAQETVHNLMNDWEEDEKI